MNNGGKEYFIKNPTIETLAIELFNQEAIYGAGWHQVSEQTRNDYRDKAAGKKPFATGVSRSKKEPTGD